MEKPTCPKCKRQLYWDWPQHLDKVPPDPDAHASFGIINENGTTERCQIVPCFSETETDMEPCGVYVCKCGQVLGMFGPGGESSIAELKEVEWDRVDKD